MLDGDAAAQFVVGADRAVRLPAAVMTPGHHRAVALRNPLYHMELVGLADDDDAVHHARTGDAFQPVCRSVGNGAAEHEVVAALGQFVGKMAQQREEKGIGDGLAFFMAERDDHADHPGAASAQLAGHL
ncbi:peptide transporter PTR1-like protein, partial [Corchorus olitorius]